MKKTLTALLLVFLLTAPSCLASELEWISVAENAYLPDESACSVPYPASVTLGESFYDLDHLLVTLLGEDYLLMERGEYDDADEYRSAEGDEPWEYRTVRIYDDEWARSFACSFSYSNPWVHGERGGEYQAPDMNMMPDESLLLCRSLLKGVIPDEWTEHVNQTRLIRDRWDYSDRWMTDEEYAAFCRERKSHYVLFDHITEAGLPITTDKVFANVGVDGLAFLDINWHDYTASEETIYPMPLKEALEMANSTRSRDCTLLYADLVYSDWLTENDTQNLSWRLITDSGTYIVDCVLKKHKCDTYEY
ncbi:MAG: hypothetical protein IIV93_02600 [Clostridia bacterium]|nr:hypothetical protein [Clostridia bacterium]